MRLLILLLLAAVASAQETIIRETLDPKTDTHVEVLALFSKPSPGGYMPVRVTIANHLEGERTIELNFSASSAFSGTNKSTSAFTFTTPSKKTVTRDILVPLSPVNASYRSSMLSTELKGAFGKATNYLSQSLNTSQPAVLLSEALYTPNGSSLDSETAKHFSGPSYGSSSAEFASRFDPKQTSDNWLAYSGYDSILMLASDWTATPAGARNAIVSWVRLGGQLILFNNSAATLAALGLPADPSMGSILLEPIGSDLALDAAHTIALVTVRGANEPLHMSVAGGFLSGWPLQNLFGARGFHYTVFIIVLVIFGILVGPVNLFVFAKSGRRHRLFVTTPLISIGASLLLMLLIILQDGFGGNGRRLVLMEVRPDDDQNAAYIRQEQFCRTGVLTRSSFDLDTPAFFTPVAIGQSRWARFTDDYDSQGTFNLDPRPGGKTRAAGDWFQSRSEHGHLLAAVVPTRGRIEATGVPDILVSTFDHPIQTLYYLDPDRHWHRAEKILPGKKFTLTPVDATLVEPAILKIRAGFQLAHASRFDRLRDRPGHYIAITRDAPAIATHPGIRWSHTTTIITGPVVSP